MCKQTHKKKKIRLLITYPKLLVEHLQCVSLQTFQAIHSNTDTKKSLLYLHKAQQYINIH